MTAEYSTMGHMYEVKCSHCGYSEGGTFSPSPLDMPSAKRVTVRVNLGDAKPTASNLLWLAKLHSRFTDLSPAELKAAFLSGPFIELGELYAEDLERVTKKVEAMGFSLLVGE